MRTDTHLLPNVHQSLADFLRMHSFHVAVEFRLILQEGVVFRATSQTVAPTHLHLMLHRRAIKHCSKIRSCIRLEPSEAMKVHQATCEICRHFSLYVAVFLAASVSLSAFSFLHVRDYRDRESSPAIAS